MGNAHTRHTRSSWRYRVIKHYRRRAIKFQNNAPTLSEYRAWSKVVDWFDSILKNKRLNQNGAIGLPPIPIPQE